MLVQRPTAQLATATNRGPEGNHLACIAAEGMQDLLTVECEVARDARHHIIAAVDPALLCWYSAAKQPGQRDAGTQLMRAASSASSSCGNSAVGGG